MNHHQDSQRDAHLACPEYRALSRRGFLTFTGLNFAAMGLPAWMPEVQLAGSQDSSRDIIISVFLRGGADGLTLVAPFGDANYFSVRPNIAVPAPDSRNALRGIALDNFFMLPPGLAALEPVYRAGHLLPVHATGQMYTKSRSHFEAERYLEAGKPDDYLLATGWLARHLATAAPAKSGAPLRGVSLSWGGLRHTLIGAPNSLPISDPQSFGMSYNPEPSVLDTLYAGAWAPLRATAQTAMKTVELLQSIDFRGYRPANGARYPETQFGRSFRSLAAMIKADIGLEVGHVDIGGWDTHAQQGSVDGGMHTQMRELGDSLGAFWSDVMQGAVRYRVTVVVVSEFGRNVRENGSKGTDHGRGGVFFLMGQNIRGGRVLATWPGLAREELEDGQDLRVTIDYRDLLAEVVRRRLNNSNLMTIFPEYAPVERGVTVP